MYECDKCNKIFKYYSKYKRHLNNKNPCIKELECDRCGKVFTRDAHLKNHLNRKNKCKPPVREIKNLVDKVKKLEKENEKLKEKIEVSVKTNPPQSNITLIPFGDEVINGKIPREVIASCMHRGASGDAELFRRIHFDDARPEWRNVKPRDVKRKKYSVWSGGKEQGGVGWCVKGEEFVFGAWPTKLGNIYLDEYLKKLTVDELSKMSPNEKAFLNKRKDELIYKTPSHITELTNEMRNVMESTKIKIEYIKD